MGVVEGMLGVEQLVFGTVRVIKTWTSCQTRVDVHAHEVRHQSLQALNPCP
jgi:hypothetical protein